MGSCNRGGQGKARDVDPSGLLKLEQFGEEIKAPPTPRFGSWVQCSEVQPGTVWGLEEGGQELALGPGVSRECQHPGASLEEDMHLGSDPSHPSQAGGKSSTPASSASQTCAEHP